MGELDEVEPAADVWVAKMMVLIENIEHHADEEESEMFPPLRSKRSADELKALAEKMEQRKYELGAPLLADKIDLTKEALMTLDQEQQKLARSSVEQEELAATEMGRTS